MENKAKVINSGKIIVSHIVFPLVLAIAVGITTSGSLFTKPLIMKNPLSSRLLHTPLLQSAVSPYMDWVMIRFMFTIQPHKWLQLKRLQTPRQMLD